MKQSILKKVKKPDAAPGSRAEKIEAESASFYSLIIKSLDSYQSTTPKLLKIIDSYLVFVMATGILQFIYVFLAGTYPYNAFLAGFLASVGSFVLTVNLRMQSNQKNVGQFANKTQERSFADFVFCHLFLFGFAVNYLG